MDPNANLDELLSLAEQVSEAWDEEDGEQDDTSFPKGLDRSDLYRFAELVQALDGWLKKGGFKPDRWTNKRESSEAGVEIEPYVNRQDKGGVTIYDEGGEPIVHWDGAEFEQDAMAGIAACNAIKIFYTSGPRAVRGALL